MGFYRPYKGLKHVSDVVVFGGSGLVFIVPIRDWNFKLFKKWHENLQSFYRPYKGLKQFFVVFEREFPICFYRPYKGLKRK